MGMQCMLQGEGQAGGFFAPIVPARGIVYGKVVRELVGGYSGEVLDWDPEGLQVESVPDAAYQAMLGAGSVVLELHAKSADESLYDVHTFSVLDAQDDTGRGAVLSAPTKEMPANATTAPAPAPPLPTPPDVEGVNVAKCKPAIQR